MKQYASSLTRVHAISQRRERLHGYAEGRNGASRLANSSAASFPEGNKCAETHCSLIVKEKKKGNSCQRVRVKRTEWEEKRNGRSVGAADTSAELAEWRRLQRKNLNKLGLPKRKEWPQCHKMSSWQGRLSYLCKKEKEIELSIQIMRWGESQASKISFFGALYNTSAIIGLS